MCSSRTVLLLGLLGLGGCFSQSLDADAERDSESGTTGSATSGPQSTAAPSATNSSSGMAEADGESTTFAGVGESGRETIGSDETTGSGADDGTLGGPCCEPHDTPGCDDVRGAQTCVCAVDDFCCTVQWDDLCVDLMLDLQCAVCGPDVVPDPKGDCCEGTPGAAGCLDQEVEACVCAADPFCCDYGWDDACADTALQSGCGCGASTGTTTSGGQSDCCEPTGDPGCLDPAVEACVCALDSFCCDTAWDNACVGQVTTGGCGACVYPAGTGDCCEVNGTEGCDDQAIQDCVCAVDPFCCTIDWDPICVSGVDNNDCGVCVVGTGSSSGTTGAPMTTGV